MVGKHGAEIHVVELALPIFTSLIDHIFEPQKLLRMLLNIEVTAFCLIQALNLALLEDTLHVDQLLVDHHSVAILVSGLCLPNFDTISVVVLIFRGSVIALTHLTKTKPVVNIELRILRSYISSVYVENLLLYPLQGSLRNIN